jgi:hypothetical protein
MRLKILNEIVSKSRSDMLCSAMVTQCDLDCEWHLMTSSRDTYSMPMQSKGRQDPLTSSHWCGRDATITHNFAFQSETLVVIIFLLHIRSQIPNDRDVCPVVMFLSVCARLRTLDSSSAITFFERVITQVDHSPATMICFVAMFPGDHPTVCQSERTTNRPIQKPKCPFLAVNSIRIL